MVTGLHVPLRFEPRSGESWRDPFGMYRRLREEDPVHHVVPGDYWVLSRYDDVFAAARDPAAFSSSEGLTFEYDERAKAGLETVAPVVFLDPPDHTEFRRLVAAGFTPRQVSAIEPAVRSFVGQRLDRLAERGGGDIVAELLKPLPSFVVAHYLGVPAADRDRFDAWTEGIVAANALGDPYAASGTVSELLGYFSELIEYRRTVPGDDVVSDLANLADLGNGHGIGGAMTALRILGFAFTMVAGGNDTTTGLLGGGLEILANRTEQRAALAADHSLVPDAVEELLRLTSPVQGLARTTTADVRLHGVTIPAGRKVMLLYASANRDERKFGPDAGELRIDRRPKQILAFGYGAHHCLGAAAARLMGRVALEEILVRFPRFEVDARRGRFAPGHFVRWYASLPFSCDGR